MDCFRLFRARGLYKYNKRYTLYYIIIISKARSIHFVLIERKNKIIGKTRSSSRTKPIITLRKFKDTFFKNKLYLI